MRVGKVYRNTTPGVTFDILVTKIQYQDEKRMKIKFWFINRFTKNIEQFSMEPEKGTIQKERLKDWVEIE